MLTNVTAISVRQVPHVKTGQVSLSVFVPLGGLVRSAKVWRISVNPVHVYEATVRTLSQVMCVNVHMASGDLNVSLQALDSLLDPIWSFRL